MLCSSPSVSLKVAPSYARLYEAAIIMPPAIATHTDRQTWTKRKGKIELEGR